MKKRHYYRFIKLPTSEIEAADYDVSKFSFPIKQLKLEKSQKSFLFKNIWLIIFFIIFIIICIILVSTELYRILFEYNIILDNPKLTIIINTFNKTAHLANLLRSLMDQSFSSYEIIITKNYQSNFSELSFLKFKRKKVKIKLIQYKEKDANLKIRIDSASIAGGEYILFLNPDESFPSNILYNCFKTAIKEKTDITQYNYFHDNVLFDDVIYQPQIFDSMFYYNDKIIQQQFHLTGKIIKKEFFLKALENIDNFYLENNNKNFDESMIIFKLFKKAETFIKVKNEGIRDICYKNSCSQNFINKDNYSKNEIEEILLYLKFLIEYTDKNVLEKRMAAQFFINILVKKTKTVNNYNKNLIKLLDEVINLYSNCNSINDYDILLINRYREKIYSK